MSEMASFNVAASIKMRKWANRRLGSARRASFNVAASIKMRKFLKFATFTLSHE